MKTAKKILEENKLSKTNGRLNILEILLHHDIALSEPEIQDRLGVVSDRATIYRTLKKFKEVGLIHPVATEGTTTKYVLKKAPEEHLHFKCNHCGNIKCLIDVKLSEYVLPDGYTKEDSNFLIIGTCNKCNSSN
ncbi:MAG: transcriptional repressor [Bacteroidales bacterium]